jgi:peptidoglycan L-alanyl-D-glutamate endopeptidase CwlK
MPKFSVISTQRLATCKPKLREVMEEVMKTLPDGMDFIVLEGVRSRTQMMTNYGKGRTAAQLAAKGIPASFANPKANRVTWLKDPFASSHAADPKDGLSRAVDIAPFPIDWNDSEGFNKLGKHVLATAKRLKIPLRWGRDWDMDGRYEEKGETDGPHFELV